LILRTLALSDCFALDKQNIVITVVFFSFFGKKLYSEVKRLRFRKLGLKALGLMLRKIGNKTKKIAIDLNALETHYL